MIKKPTLVNYIRIKNNANTKNVEKIHVEK